MTPNNKAYDMYKENSVYTATPEELTLMLYNGLVKFIMKAQHSLIEKSIEKTNNNILRAQDIVTELRCTLDMKYPVSQNLLLLYDYMFNRLIEANIKKDNEILEEVLGFAKEFRDIWMQAMKIAKQTQSRQQQIAK